MQYAEQKTQAINIISALYDKYNGVSDNFMIDKLTNYIVDQLPTIITQIEKNNIQKNQRNEELTNEQNLFISSFFAGQQYFYCPNTEYYFVYDGKHFTNLSEDEIVHKILSNISRERTLMVWKQKTKSIIIKKIKENNITSCIPDSITIQNVLSSICPSVFASKTEAKYFLTVLGDNIMKKSGAYTLLHLLSVKSGSQSIKQWINQLNAACHLWFGVNLNHSIKYKYHQDHVYSTLRLISFVNVPQGTWNYSHLLDLLCVACHYSNRYGSSDAYLTNYSNDYQLMNYVNYLHLKNSGQIVDEFVNQMLIPSETGNITWKNMQFLWKLYLKNADLPNILSLSQLKSDLRNCCGNYDSDNDCFTGYTSKHLPLIYDFNKFWSTTMIEDDAEFDLEIGEIALLFKQWNHNVGISEPEIIHVLQYFYPQIEIDQQKFINKIKCNLWDKSADIETAIRFIDMQNGSLHECYQKYCEISANKQLRVSKLYFEKYMSSIS